MQLIIPQIFPPKTLSKFNLLINTRKWELCSLSQLKQINLLLPCVRVTRTQSSNICISTSDTSGTSVSGTQAAAAGWQDKTCRQTWYDFSWDMVTFIFNKWSVSINHRLYTKDGRGWHGVTHQFVNILSHFRPSAFWRHRTWLAWWSGGSVT